MTTPSLSIGWFPRERFELAAESLASLLAHSPPCPLFVVDAATPRRILEGIRPVLVGAAAEIIPVERPVLPSEAKNLILSRVDTDYVALVENDVLFTPGWLDALLAACEEAPADVAVPVIYDGRERKEHFDKHLGRIVASRDHRGRREILPMTGARNDGDARRTVHFIEQHCVLYRTATFDRIGRFDEELNTRDEVDVSMALWDAGCTVVLEPAAQVHYIPPPSWRPSDEELPFYRYRWDLQRAARSRERIRQRWNLAETPGDLGFVRYRNLIARLPDVRCHLEGLSSGAATVLLEDGDWFGTEITDGLDLSPFPELKGGYGGFPASDTAAMAELERRVAEGTRQIIVGFPAYWWFDYLPGLGQRLDELAVRTRDDELLRVYTVR